MDRILVLYYSEGGQFMIDMEHLAAISYDELNARIEFYLTFRTEPITFDNAEKGLGDIIQKRFSDYKNYVGSFYMAPLKEPDDTLNE